MITKKQLEEFRKKECFCDELDVDKEQLITRLEKALAPEENKEKISEDLPQEPKTYMEAGKKIYEQGKELQKATVELSEVLRKKERIRKNDRKI